MKLKYWFMIAITSMMVTFFSSCDNNGPAEKAGEKVDEAVEETEEEVEETIEDADEEQE